jgi:hypothetical protein
VSRSAAFSAVLSAAASAPTITSSSVVLRGPEGNVIAADVASSSANVVVTPTAGALPGDTTYTVSFAPTIQDTTGRALGGALTKTFTTISQAWGAKVTDVADVSDLNAGQPAVAYDTSGNLILAWNAAGPTTDTLYTSQRSAATGTWSVPVPLASLTNGAIARPSLTCGTTGDCYLAWTQWQSGSHRTAQIARFDGSTSAWEVPSSPPLAGAIGDVNSVRPVYDEAGNLTLLATTGTQIMAMSWDATTGTWASPNTYTLGASTMESVVTMDPLGNISAVWVHDTPSSRWVYGNHYNVRTGVWSPEQPIDNMLNTTMMGSLSLTLDGTNAATVVFARGGFISEVNASRLDPATGLWGASTRLDNINPNVDAAIYPRAIGDAAGYVTAVWGQNSGLWSSRLSPNPGTWSAPVAMSATYGATGGMSGTFLTVDVAGNVTAAWSNDFGAAASRFLVKDATWGPVTDISVPTQGELVFTSRTMQIAAGATGDVAAAWYQRNDLNGTQQYKLEINISR